MTVSKPASRKAPTRKTAAKKVPTGYDPFAPQQPKAFDQPRVTDRPKMSVYTKGLASDTAMIEKPEFLLPPGDGQNPLSLWAMMLNPSEKKLFVPEVPLSKVKAREGDHRQVRGDFNNESLEQLAQTIKDMGLMKPPELTYDSDTDTFWIETGERRVRSCRIAELSTIPAFVFLERPKQPIVRQLTENIQAEGLSAFETLDSLIRIQEELKADGMDSSYAALARIIQKPRSYVQKHFNLESINIELRDLVKKYDLLTDYQYMDYLRKIWDISSDLVHVMLENRKEYGFNRSFAMLLLKGLKSDYAKEIEQAFRNFSLVRSEQIDAALRYFALDKSDSSLIIAAGPAKSVSDEGYIERLIFEHESVAIRALSPAEDTVSPIDQTSGESLEASSEAYEGKSSDSTPQDVAGNIPGEDRVGEESKVSAPVQSDESTATIVSAGQRVISGSLKGIGTVYLDLTRKDNDSTYAWFIAENKELVRGKLKHFDIKHIS